MKRYARQMILPGIGIKGQSRLNEAHILVVGAGGLGCAVLSYLASAGVGQITLFDPDIVEETNLHRQVLYRMADLGRPKAIAARTHLLATNPDLVLHAHVQSIDPANAPDVIRSADLVIDAADSFAASYTLSDICLREAKPLISASVVGQAGYVGGYCGSAPSLRAVFPDLPPSEISCASNGVMGPVVGLIGTVQAQMALQVLIGHDPSPLGRVVTVDAATWQSSSFTFHSAPEPESYFPFLAHKDLTPQDQIFDLRSTAETPVLITPNAIRKSQQDLISFDPESDGRVVLCCSSGLRAWRAALQLHSRGFRDMALLADRNHR
ncbi:HesA/MoeB/ThiF family protein [uncultured Roseovarius sp.]|uniref:HesA/MoeB/ThiF family protein n=1 Tax=uncultured Roseovarius sp. TaxID=293344 RepID=UPI002616790A|nr:HesA/MoeB/ThiF family protein [uncultured Roseovarius sp.]